MTNRERLAFEIAAADAACTRAVKHMQEHEPEAGTMLDVSDVIEMAMLKMKFDMIDLFDEAEAREVLARIHALALRVLPVQGGVN